MLEVVHTESRQRISYGWRPAMHQTIRMRIKKFEDLLLWDDLWEREEWSEGVSSVLVPRVVWKMRVSEGRGRGAIISLHLTGPMADGKETLQANYHIFFVGAAGGGTHSILRGSHEFGKGGVYAQDSSYIHGDRLEEALRADGSLLVVADIDFTPPDDIKDLLSKWHNSIGKLLESVRSTPYDCTLMVDGELLEAHRSILAAMSPVFEMMLSNDSFQEARDGVVHIEDPPGMLKDSTAKPYRALLFYAYRGYLDWTLYAACKRDVLVLACKYLVENLKHYMERQLAREITANGFLDMAMLADSYNCGELKKACAEYLSSNFQVMHTPQWNALPKKKRLDLAGELRRLMSKTTAAKGGTK